MQGYTVNLYDISIKEFQQMLESKDILPGRRCLLDHMDERFRMLEGLGIHNLGQLAEELKNKKRLQRFAQSTAFEEEYLVILRREALSYAPKPTPLRDIPGVDVSAVALLEQVGVKSSKHLFDWVKEDGAATLAEASGAPEHLCVEYAELCDLLRVFGVGPVFARLFHDCDVRSVARIAALTPAGITALYERLMELNARKQYTRARFNERHLEYCVEMAQWILGKE